MSIDQPADIRPFARLARSLGPALRGTGFKEAFEPFQDSMEIVKVPEPFRALILASQSLRPDVVLGYWDDIMRNDPEELQTRIEAAMGKTTCPYLAVFGRQLAPTEREYMLTRLEGLQITECPGNGHFVHLVDPDQFTSQLRSFLEFCTLRADSASPL